ncbi:hypothetical protein N0A02_00550 [Paraburkholderia acidicola]|uniref:AraC family transcriptional regulator n=1 Tax=Paraburkholderia acidicola TaxID=1912599 RepID=A0ABV1LFS5_9BURK
MQSLDPIARAPCALRRGQAPAQPVLHGAIVAIICRDTHDLELNDAQRLFHFPASPLACLFWYRGCDVGLVEGSTHRPLWKPFDRAVTLCGSQSVPATSWAATSGRGCIVYFAADAAQALFDLDLSAVHDRPLRARELLRETWLPLIEALLRTNNDAATLATLEQHLAPRWQTLQHHRSTISSLRRSDRR